MKTGLFKSMGHEVSYVFLITLVLITLTAIIFPLFIALLPMVILIGGFSLWQLDHIKKNNHS
jgi:hypothetical protein